MSDISQTPIPLYSGELARRVEERLESNAYRLATNDSDFLGGDNLRPVRLQLEYLKTEEAMQANGIRSTIIVFGSARLRSKTQLSTEIAALEDKIRTAPENQDLRTRLALLVRRKAYVKYYDEARKFSTIVSTHIQKEGRCDFVVITGGGPGIMEAANRGADDVGARSIGLNIDLPREQVPNPYITPDLCFQFRYFALRKLHFLMRARALVAFPGGFGTLDELFEVLTLVQTRKVPPLPIILIGETYWSRVVDFEFLAEEGFIERADLNLFTIVDTAEAAVQAIHNFYGGEPPAEIL
ncbi:MAG TPA: TIGR00730 family Rossman fold protein [Rhizobiales bacterium]|nr:TIGR00730 family Rossman fold protein [Hyphomicrobiales bacterium]